MRGFDDLLKGLAHPEDLPPELREVARLVALARQPATGAELANEAMLTSEIAAAVRRATGPVAVGGRHWRGRVAKVVSAKVIGVTAALLVGGGVAAAATGSLPAPVQQVVSDGLHHLGIKVPRPAASPSTGTAMPGTVPVGRRSALCLAYAKNSAHGMPAESFGELRRLATAAGEDVATYCEGVTPPAKHNPVAATAGSTPGSTAPGSSTTPGSGHGKAGTNGHGKGHNGHGNGSGQHSGTTPKGTVLPGSQGNGHGNGHGNKPGGGTQPGSGHGKKTGSGHRNGTKPGSGHKHTTGKGSNPGNGNGHGNKPVSNPTSTTSPGKGVGSGSNPGKGHGAATSTTSPTGSTAGSGHGATKNSQPSVSPGGRHGAASSHSGWRKRAASSHSTRRSVGKGAQLLVEEI